MVGLLYIMLLPTKKKEAYKLLLRLGADKNIANNDGLKPADILQ